MRIYEVNQKIGFWAGFGFIDLDKGNVWPREYRWKCGCIGVSGDGENVKLLPCPKHVELCQVPEGWDVDAMRQAALSRMDTRGRFRGVVPHVSEMRDVDRLALVKIFDEHQGKKNVGPKNAGGDSGSSQG